ncbi:hypothetical protein [Sulfurimonas sp.]|uniref:hypothetical protein n=1 Tax=Sulfurimonas sp. TaxID=2022749 RepID=UPI0025CC7181|nr:hypothetical protein [Sulfurimonas sp.]MCK9455195.1 hypothetical protein [Sulfurimonas sp.]
MAKDMKNAGAMSLFAAGIQTGGLMARMFGYMAFYTLLVFIVIMLVYITSENVPVGEEDSFIIILANTLIWGGSTLPFVFWERSIRKFRRKHGLSIYKNVREELEQMEINERVAKEHKAFVANGIARADGEKKDLDYWFGLLQKGAITQDEYNVKKSELMAV